MFAGNSARRPPKGKVRIWRILAVKRSPKIASAASAVRGIEAICERVICGKVALKAEGVKNS
jgi:hypothetical protein